MEKKVILLCGILIGFPLLMGIVLLVIGESGAAYFAFFVAVIVFFFIFGYAAGIKSVRKE